MVIRVGKIEGRESPGGVGILHVGVREERSAHVVI